MAEPTTKKKRSAGSQNKLLIGAVAVLAAVAIGSTAALVLNDDKDDGQTIQYASEATVMLDQASLQAAVDEAMRNARDGNIALRYKNNAYSEDGVTFSCYIANSDANKFDMFLAIFADADQTDQLYLSGLVPPGSGFEEITLNHALAQGDHKVYVTLTQVDTNENGEQVLRGQVTHTMDFHVS